MKYLLTAIGTRGDIEPFLAVGELLLKNGHEVVGLFPAQYGPLALESNIRFLPFDAGFIDMIEGEVGQQALGGTKSFWGRIKAYYRLYKTSKVVNNKIFREQIEFIEAESPDVIIHSIKATVPIYWGVKTGKPSIMLSPIPCVTHAVKDKSSMAFRGRDFGRIVNGWTYSFTRYATIKNLRVYLKKLNEPDPGQKALSEAMMNETAVYTVSPSFFNLEGQPDHVHFLGYQERNKSKHWTPSSELQQFIDRNKRFMFITFGSMSNPEPEVKTQIVMNALTQLEIPAIINTAGGGLKEPEVYDQDMIHFVRNIPYDWILPKAYAAIHHGGAGTTHLVVKYGCASTIIPHIIDQYFWNNVMSELQIGPKGTSIARLNENKLVEIMMALWSDENYKNNARMIGKRIMEENHEGKILQVLTP